VQDILSGTPNITPTAVAVLLILALALDAMSVGPDSVRDRIAFVIAYPVAYQAWNGSDFDRWTVDNLLNIITNVKAEAGQTLAQASATAILSTLVFVLWMFTMGALVPDRYSARMGRFATYNFRRTRGGGLAGGGAVRYQLNAKLWTCAILLGLTSDLPQGIAGDLIRFTLNVMGNLVAGLPNLLLEVN
jgi:hypothetical protein